MAEKIFLVDGHSHLFQAFYAIRNLHSPSGTPVNAVFGFTSMLQKLLREKKPDYILVAFDTGKPTFRHEDYREYKANREEAPEEYDVQVPIVHRLLDAYRIPVLAMDGYEADDIMGTIAKKTAALGLETVLVTRDKDMLQLLGPNTFVYDSKKDETIGPDELKERMGIEPQQVIDMLALAGDSTDNVPGVRLIGQKTALQLIKEFGSLENVLANTDKIKQKKRREYLEADAEKALLSKHLVTIKTDVPVEFDLEACRWKGPDEEKLKALFEELGFRRFLAEFEETRPAPEVDGEYHLVNTKAAFQKFRTELAKQERFAFDLETTSISPMEGEIVGLSFAWKEKEAYYVPVMGPSGAEVLNREDVLGELRPILEDPARGKIGQNLKYDSVALRKYGPELRGICFDTMVASYLLSPDRGRHGLDDLASDLLGHRNIPISDLIGKGKDQATMDTVPLDKIKDYACQDADIALRLERALAPKLREMNLASLFETIEVPLVEVLAELEWNGIALDTDFLAKMSEELGRQMEALEKEIYQAAGEEFNISSPKQLGEILYGKIGLTPPKKTRKKTAYSTSADVLEVLAVQHELPRLVLKYRQLSKLKSTYVDALPGYISERDGRVHASFNQTATGTGRLSSSDPNLQNIPVKTPLGREIRRAFIAGDPGSVLMSADYSQIELRILAHSSKDPALIKAFQADMDIHAFVASQIYNVPVEDVDETMRDHGKVVNFSVIYGKTAYGLSRELGVDQRRAQRFIDSYFQRYQAVKRFREEVLAKAREDGYVSTLMGRRRYFSGLNSANSVTRAAEERAAFNAVIQGSAADMIKAAMISIHRELKGSKFKTKMLLQIHDELVFEVPEGELDEVKEMVGEKMRSAMPLDVPVKVNVGAGRNWLEAQH